MQTLAVSRRVRYPLRAKLGVAAAALGFLAELAMLGLFMMPLVPLVPVFILVMLGNGFVLASVLSWAASLGTPEPLRLERAETAGKIAEPRAA